MNVPVDSDIVIVFDQDMDFTVPPFQSVSVLVGNYAIQPANVIFSGTWGEDDRTLILDLQGNMPTDTTITWTLNPPGGAIVPPFRSQDLVAVATVSGSFRTAANGTGGPGPRLVSITPAPGATDVSPTAPMIFEFDQEMDTTVTLIPSSPPFFIGNYHITPANISPFFTGSWSADGRTLTFTPTASVPLNTTVNWTLNPTGTSFPLVNLEGQPMAATNGSYRILGDTGGSTNEVCIFPTLTGAYVLTKLFDHVQITADEVIPAEEAPATFSAFVQSPAGGPAVTSASLTFPGGAEIELTNQFGFFTLLESFETEGELEAAAPAGDYTMRFEQSGQPERVIPMAVPVTLTIVPMVSNYAAAQEIDPARDFTLQWNPFDPRGPGAFIRVTITDGFGNLIFQAPNPCVPRELEASDTSTVIPANYLRPGVIYRGLLEFGEMFYSSTNDVPQMSGYGAVERQTQFTIQAVGSTGGTLPAVFTSFQLLTNGHPQFTLIGSPDTDYDVERTGDLTEPDWTVVGTATTDGTGEAAFEDDDDGLTFPAFYRAVGE